MITPAAGGFAGIAYDTYAGGDFKFAALDLSTGTVVLGHVFKKSWVIDATFAATLPVGVDQKLKVQLDATTVTVLLNGTVLGSFTYNGGILDGGIGLFTRTGATSFDNVHTMVGTHETFAVDPTPPTLTPPSNLTRSTDAGKATATISDSAIGTASATDNVPGVTVTRSGVPAGNIFTLGVTQIVWTATDVFGNKTTKTQTVTVVDTERPVLTVPPNVTRTSNSAVVVTDAELGTATARDNAGAVTVVRSGVPAGNLFPLGTTTITYTATDAAGNVSTGTQTVTVTGITAVVAVAATDATGAEQGLDPIVFTVTRSANTTTQVVVNLTWGGTAASTDYNVTVVGGTLSANRATLTLVAGATSATITVTPVDDNAAEATETVTLAIAAGTGYTAGTPASASGSIADNDTRTLSIANASVTEADKSTSVTLTVTLSSASTSTVTVSYATANGTALAGSDYTAASGTLTFSAGQTSKTITITILGDKVKEATEAFTVTLSSAVGAAIATGTATVTIVDNDGALMAASAPSAASSAAALTQPELDTVVSAAEAEWLASAPDADFTGVVMSVGDLAGLQLGLTVGRTITIDATAAGWGWSLAGGGMDLASVVLHELGHALGLEHDEAGLMADTLAAGETRSVRPVAVVPIVSAPAIPAPRPARVESVRSAAIRPGSATARTLHPRRLSRPAARVRR
jgi:hypothetical protein